jgi:dipeptidase E
MKRAFLLSKHYTGEVHEKVLTILKKKPQDVKIAISANAADSLRLKNENKELDFVNLAIDQLRNHGFKPEKLDLSEFRTAEKHQELIDLISGYDVLFFTGGLYLELLNYFYETGLIETYPKLLENGLLHIGFSAGALIFSPEMKYYELIHEGESSVPMHNKGLGLFPHYIFPHYFDKAKYTKIYEETLKKYAADSVKLIPLTNGQAIYMEDENWEII